MTAYAHVSMTTMPIYVIIHDLPFPHHIHWYCIVSCGHYSPVSTFPADGTFISVGVGVGMLLLLVMSIVVMIVVVVKRRAARNQKRKRKIRGNLHYNTTVVVKREMEGET